MSVVANEDGDIVMQDPLSQESGIVTEAGDEDIDDDDDEGVITSLKIERPNKKATNGSKIQHDMDTCFGFDEVGFFVLFSEYQLLIMF